MFIRLHITPYEMEEATKLRVVGHLSDSEIDRHLELGRGIYVGRGALRGRLKSARIRAM